MDREYQPIASVAKPPAWRTDDRLPDIQETHRQLWEATLGCKSRDALAKLQEIEIHEFAINSEQVEGRFTLTRRAQEGILIEGPQTIYIACEADLGADTNHPDEIRKCLSSEISLVREIVEKGENQDPLTQELIQSWHRRLVEHQREPLELQGGEYKFREVFKPYPDGSTQQFSRPNEVKAEMAAFLQMSEALEAPAEFLGPWQAYALHRIHPFLDGNSRTSRIMAARTFAKEGLPPVSLSKDQKKNLFQAYMAADQGDLMPILALMQNELEKTMQNRLSAIRNWEQGLPMILGMKNTPNAIWIQPSGQAEIRPKPAPLQPGQQVQSKGAGR